MTQSIGLITAGLGACPAGGGPCDRDLGEYGRADLRAGTPAGQPDLGVAVELAACRRCGRPLLTLRPFNAPADDDLMAVFVVLGAELDGTAGPKPGRR